MFSGHLGDVLKLVAALSIIIVSQLAIRQSESMASSLGFNAYCQSNQADQRLCQSEKRFPKFITIYYDGLGKLFMDFFKSQTKYGNNIVLNKILHEGISDSLPAFYTYFSGHLPNSYDVDFTTVDNLFHQFRSAKKQPTTFIYKGMIRIFDDDYKKKNLLEHRGLAHTLSPHFIDWSQRYVEKYNSGNERVIDNTVDGIDAIIDYLEPEFKRARSELQQSKDRIFDDLSEKFNQHSNMFLYVPEVDDFSHNTTIINKDYIGAIGSLLANLEVLMEYIDSRQKDTVLVVMSDHGGDESIYKQERVNHETPNNAYENSPFLMFFNPLLKDINYNQKAIIKSTQVSGVIGSFIQGVNFVSNGHANTALFMSNSEQFLYLHSFEMKLKSIVKAASLNPKIVSPLDDAHFSGAKEILLSNKVEEDDVGTTEFLDKYAALLEQISKEIETTHRSVSQANLRFISFALSSGLLILLVLPSLKGSLDRQSATRSDYRTLAVHYGPFIAMWLSIAVQGEVIESRLALHLFGFLILSWLFGNPTLKLSTNFYWILLTISVYLFSLLGLAHEQFFYNLKDKAVLFISTLILSVHTFLYSREEKSRSSWTLLTTLISIQSVIIVVFDFLCVDQKTYEPSPMGHTIAIIFNIIHVATTVIAILSSPKTQVSTLEIIILQHVFWTCTLYERALFSLILIPIVKRLIKKDKRNAAISGRDFSKLKVFAIFIFSYLILGNKFDWKNRIRLLYKIDVPGLYRNIYQIAGALLSYKIWLKDSDKQSANLMLDFVYGGFFAVICLNMPNEYRLANIKMFESLIIAYATFKALIILKAGIDWVRLRNGYQQVSNSKQNN